MFLPSQGRTLTHASILVKSLARSYASSIVMELGGKCGNPLYAKWGIVVIHYGNITLCPLGYEDNHLMRTSLTSSSLSAKLCFRFIKNPLLKYPIKTYALGD